jgi:4-hydroxybenzoate polyprenyltransferase
LLFFERFLFIYAITIPFEIRDRQKEQAIGNRTIPLLYGVKKSKMLGYVLLILFCILCLIRECIYDHASEDIIKHFAALALSALTAALLIYKTNDNRSRWYYKFLIDGTMIEQFLLLILVGILC